MPVTSHGVPTPNGSYEDAYYQISHSPIALREPLYKLHEAIWGVHLWKVIPQIIIFFLGVCIFLVLGSILQNQIAVAFSFCVCMITCVLSASRVVDIRFIQRKREEFNTRAERIIFSNNDILTILAEMDWVAYWYKKDRERQRSVF